MVRWVAEEGTVVGVIGDPEQAIFGFLDASASHFREFLLDGHRTYAIAGNRRSTGAIVSFLNRVRTDGLQQHPVRPDAGTAPVVYGGNLADALNHARSATPRSSPLLVLARKHAAVMQAHRAGDPCSNDPWETLEEADSDRCRFLNFMATAVDLAQRRLYDLAIQRLVQGISSRHGFRKPLSYVGAVDLAVRRSLALALLEYIVGQHEYLLSRTALDFYNALREHVPQCLDGLKLPAVISGKKFHVAASACRYGDLIHALRTPDETRMIRTVHQAKGARHRLCSFFSMTSRWTTFFAHARTMKNSASPTSRSAAPATNCSSTAQPLRVYPVRGTGYESNPSRHSAGRRRHRKDTPNATTGARVKSSRLS